VVSIGATSQGTDTADDGLALLQALEAVAEWQPVVDDGGPIAIASGSAADMRLHQGPGGLAFELDGASLTLARIVAGLTTSSLTFANGLVLVVADNAAGQTADRLANRIDIGRDFAAALDRDNQLLGPGGDDRQTCGTGDDRLTGGAGRERLRGMDRADLLRGGAGADEFVFHADEAAGDIIADFERGVELVDLGRAGPGQFQWIGAGSFTHQAGELRVAVRSAGLRVEGDADGDGAADLSFLVKAAATLDPGDFLL